MSQLAAAKPADRLARLGRAPTRRKPEGGPPELTARHKLLVSYMIDGCPHADVCRRIWVDRPIVVDGQPATVRRHPQSGEALTLIEAADLLRIRRRNARELMTTPTFKAVYDEELRRYRDGEKAASLRTLVEVRDDPGLGKAADRKVRMQAALGLMGEAGAGSATSVQVNLGIQQITAGVVIDLRDDDEVARDEERARQIEGTAE